MRGERAKDPGLRGHGGGPNLKAARDGVGQGSEFSETGLEPGSKCKAAGGSLFGCGSKERLFDESSPVPGLSCPSALGGWL